MKIAHARGELAADRCLVMGIVNRTADSFYDGGRMGLDESLEHALRLVDEGADILDVGAVRAGPGEDIPEDDEAARLLPLVEAIASRTSVPISVEASRPAVAQRALASGAAIVNDVSALADPRLADVCADAGAALVLMHTGGQIRGRPLNPRYGDVVQDVLQSWSELAATARERGVPNDQLIVDPGLDFGKTTWHSLELIRRLPELVAADWPVLVAPSRKDVVGETLDLPVGERLEGTLALVALSAHYGCAIVRVHDVLAALRVVRMIEAVAGKRPLAAPVRGLWE